MLDTKPSQAAASEVHGYKEGLDDRGSLRGRVARHQYVFSQAWSENCLDCGWSRSKLIKTPSRATFLLFDAVMSRKRKRNEDDEEEKETEESEIEEAKGQGCICPVCHRKEKRMKSNNPNSRWVKCDRCQKWYHGKCVGITKETWEEWDERGDAAPAWYCGSADHPAPSLAPAAALPPPDMAAPPSPSVLAPPLAPAPLPVASSIQQEDEDTGERPEKNRNIIMDIDEN